MNALAVVGARGIASAQAAEDRSAIESARLSLESARYKAERMQSASDAYPAREITSARADVARAAAELERLRAGGDVHRATRKRELARADKQIVRAPFDGVLAVRFVDVGDFVSAGQVLARVVDDTRFVRFALPAAEHARLRVGDSVRRWPKRALPRGPWWSVARSPAPIWTRLCPACGNDTEKRMGLSATWRNWAICSGSSTKRWPFLGAFTA